MVEKTKISKYKKVNIGTKKKPLKIPNTYVKGLSKKDKKKQIKSIKKQTTRPKLKSFKGKRSTHAQDFEKKYGVKITNRNWIDKNLFKKKGQDIVLNKGKKAYFTSGSRPNQTPYSWAYARLASYLLKRGAFKVDGKALWEKYKVKKKLKKV
jgi:transposase